MSVHSPLTTVFTQPSACTTGYYLAGTEWTNPPIIQATIAQISSCFASGWTSAVNPYAKGANTWTGYPICPNGQSVAGTRSDASLQTTAVCCSYNWGNVFTNGNVIGSTTYSFWVCQSAFSTASTTVDMPPGMTGQTIFQGTGNVESTAEYVFVYDRADITSGSLSSTSSLPSGALTTGALTSSSATLTSGITCTNSSGSGCGSSQQLSTGAKAGIGIAAALVILSTFGVAILCLRIRHRRLNMAKMPSADVFQPGVELDGQFRIELHEHRQPLELAAQETLVELDAR